MPHLVGLAEFEVEHTAHHVLWQEVAEKFLLNNLDKGLPDFSTSLTWYFAALAILGSAAASILSNLPSLELGTIISDENGMFFSFN